LVALVALVVFFKFLFIFFTFCIFGSYSFLAAVLLFYGTSSMGLCLSGNREINTWWWWYVCIWQRVWVGGWVCTTKTPYRNDFFFAQ